VAIFQHFSKLTKLYCATILVALMLADYDTNFIRYLICIAARWNGKVCMKMRVYAYTKRRDMQNSIPL